MKLHGALIVATCLVLASSAAAQRTQLRVGNDAPTLDIKTWVKGDPATIEQDNVYVIEFWATWCPPCRAAIPHLSELQNAYQADGLRIIGVSTEEEADVKRFVESQGDRISYTIAVDNRQSTNRLWMQAARRDTLPTSFIVDRRGRIQFIGNPHSPEFPKVLEAVINGRYDARLFAESESMIKAAENARRMRNWRQAFHLYDQVIAVDPFIFAPLELEKFDIMMVEMEDAEAAYRHARVLLGKYSDDPGMLSRLAEKIATDPKIDNDKRDLDLALEAVQKAEQVVDNRNDPRLLASMALVHFHRGETARAVTLQRRAWRTAVPARKPGYERALRMYQDAASGDESEASTGRSSTSFRR